MIRTVYGNTCQRGSSMKIHGIIMDKKYMANELFPG
jgi:hypothetical protein